MTLPPGAYDIARLYLQEHGDDAEEEVRRLAGEFMAENNPDDAEKLFDVFRALKELRQTTRRRDQPLN